jgi:hypothetical protein
VIFFWNVILSASLKSEESVMFRPCFFVLNIIKIIRSQVVHPSPTESKIIQNKLNPIKPSVNGI